MFVCLMASLGTSRLLVVGPCLLYGDFRDPGGRKGKKKLGRIEKNYNQESGYNVLENNIFLVKENID